MTSCWLPYYHAEILTDGTVRPCCKYQGDWIPSIDQYTSKDRSDFNQAVLPSQCDACKVDANSFSYRKHRTIEFVKRGWREPTEPSLRNLNISIDNVCASSCLQCSPKQSTTIGHLLGQPIRLSWDLNLLDPYLGSIEHMTISGGEPLQSPRLVDLCTKLSNTQIKTIAIPTGLAKVRTQNIQALKNLNKPIYCRVSIDAPWPLNEWIRGCDQDDWLRGYDQVNSFNIAWQITIGAYNIFALPELLDYIETVNPNRHIQPSPIIWPESMNSKQLPKHIKQQIIDKLLSYTPRPNAKEIIDTALNLLREPPTLDWERCQSDIERLPSLRGCTETLDDFFKRYL